MSANIRRRTISHALLFTAISFAFILSATRSRAAAGSGDLSMTVQPNSGVIFFNNSSSAAFIHISPASGSSECKADWAVYNADGSVKASGTGSRGLQSVPAGGKTVVTNSGSAAISVYGESSAFSAGISKTPALLKAKLAPGKSVVFTNLSPSLAMVSSGAADFAAYESNGSAYGCGAASASLHPVPAGGRIVVTNNTSAAITAFCAYEAFAYMESDSPALLKTSLGAGSTVAFLNKTSEECTVKSSGRYDYASYGSSGAVQEYGAESSGDRTVPAGGRIVITNPGPSAVDVYGAYELFSAEAGKSPALKKDTLSGGATAVFSNLTSEKLSVCTGSADYASYGGDGVAIDFAASSSGKHDVEAYGRIVVTNSGNTAVSAYAPYEAFALEDTPAGSPPALLKHTLAKGETVAYENLCSAPVLVHIYKADFACYDGSGAYNSCGAEASGLYTVPAYGKIIISNPGTSLASAYAPYNTFSAKEQTSPALLKTTLSSGSTVVYFNMSSDNAPVTAGKVDFCLSQPDCSVSSFGSGGSGEFIIPSDGFITLTNSGTYPVSVRAPEMVFTSWEAPEPALYMTEIAPGGRAVYYSTADYEQSVYIGKCSYAVYKRNGALYDSRSYFGGGTVAVPAGGRIEVLNNGTAFITLYGPRSCFAAENGWMYKYDVKDAGLELKLPISDLASVDTPSRALSAVANALDSFTDEQLASVAALERLSLFIEEAASRASALKKSGARLEIESAALEAAAQNCSSVLGSLSSAAGERGIALKRSLKLLPRFICDSDSIEISFSGDFTEITADRIIICSPSSALYIEKDAVKPGSVIKASYKNGSVTLEASVPVILGLAPSSGNSAEQVIEETASTAIISSKYNPVTGLIEGKTGKSGTYLLKSAVKRFADMSGRPEEMQRAVSFLAARGIVNGVSSDSFSPNAKITRAEIAAMLVRMLGDSGDAAAGETQAFSDVADSDWFASAALASSKLGLIGGYEDGSFRGQREVTKNELLSAAARLLRARAGWYEADSASLSKYKDGVADWARKDAALALSANLIPERVDGSFSGGSSISRGDAAIVLYRLFMLLW